MTEFQFDTSGFVYLPSHHGGNAKWSWGGLAPFTQGYVEALLIHFNTETQWSQPLTPANAWGFSDLAPETLARIMEDCASRRGLMATDSSQLGRWFWERRQAGEYSVLPPLTPYLGDDGKVYLREAA